LADHQERRRETDQALDFKRKLARIGVQYDVAAMTVRDYVMDGVWMPSDSLLHKLNKAP